MRLQGVLTRKLRELSTRLCRWYFACASQKSSASLSPFRIGVLNCFTSAEYANIFRNAGYASA
jgi:hypothetical protein